MIRWAIRKLGVKEWLVSTVTPMHTGAKTVVRVVYGNSNGSALSSLLFVIKLYLEDSELPYHGNCCM